jgi:hypothetical protein
MLYLNCPRCRLSIDQQRRRAAMENCPRCLAKLGQVTPLFQSTMPWRLLAAPMEETTRRAAAGDAGQPVQRP